jgi:Oxidoreductase FAD-binding domain
MTEISARGLTTTPTSYAPTPALTLVEELDGVLLCTGVEDITHDVRSFTFAIPGGVGLAFDPGQYLTLNLPVDGAYVERCYTISSPPTRPHDHGEAGAGRAGVELAARPPGGR